MSATLLSRLFADQLGFYSWQANCAVKNNTNGVNKLEQHSGIGGIKGRLHPIGVINQRSTRSSIVSLPRRDVPTIFRVAGNAGSIDSFILPDGKTGVVRNAVARTLLHLLIIFSRSMSETFIQTNPSSTSSSTISSPQ